MKPKTKQLLKKNEFFIYLFFVVSIVLIINYYYIPATGFSNSGGGTVNLNILEAVCGDGDCGYNENVTCCNDCGCPNDEYCFDNVCVERKRGESFSNFTIEPSSYDLKIEKDQKQTLEYTLTNLNPIKARINLGISDNGKMLILNQTEFIIDAKQSTKFEVEVSSLSTRTGMYYTKIIGTSGLSTVNASLNIEVFELEEKPLELQPILLKVTFNLIWLIIPISVAILIYFYVLKNLKIKPKKK